MVAVPEREDVIALLSDLVRIDSINPSLVPGAAGEGELARYVAAWLERAGLAVELREVAPGRPNVVARLPGRTSGPSLLLNAHLDTVGVAGMADPFTPRVEGDRLYGRGAYDMKSGLAAVMLAAAMVAAQGGGPGELVVTAVADEEYVSLGTEALVRTMQADAAIVTEPTGLRLCVAHKGFAWFTIETEGRAAHGSKPEEGVDAIAHMGRVLVGLEGLGALLASRTPHPLLGVPSVHASLIQGGQELSSYPERCLLQVERRTLPGETAESVSGEVAELVAALHEADAAVRARSELFFWRDSFEVAQDEAIVQVLSRVAAEVLGNPPARYGDTPWMDAALLAREGIPTVVFGPGGAGAHATEEWTSISETAACAVILARTTLTFGSGSPTG